MGSQYFIIVRFIEAMHLHWKNNADDQNEVLIWLNLIPVIENNYHVGHRKCDLTVTAVAQLLI